MTVYNNNTNSVKPAL